ncbi:MAG: hypothetical protein ABIP95_04535 [Pelobium sp.]
MKKHLLIRFLTGTIPIFLILYDILSAQQKGPDNYFGGITITAVLGWVFSICWMAWMLIETIMLFKKRQRKEAFANLIIFAIFLGSVIFLYFTPIHIN